MDLPRAVSGKTRAVAIQREIRPCFDEVIRSQPCAAIVRLTLVAFMTTNHGRREQNQPTWRRCVRCAARLRGDRGIRSAQYCATGLYRSGL